MWFAGFWRRLLAYLIDALPITVLVTLVFYFFLGFDSTLRRYVSRAPGDLEARSEYLVVRNQIRGVSMALYLVSCVLMESSAWRGTLGKWVLGIEVINEAGSPLTLTQAAKRNSAKSLSFLVFGLGCLWVAWSPTKQGWHDKMAGTFVVERT